MSAQSSSSSSSSEKHEDSGEDTTGGETSVLILALVAVAAALGAAADASLSFLFPVETTTEDLAAVGCCSWCGCALGALRRWVVVAEDNIPTSRLENALPGTSSL